jgi:hypothetical protein
VGKHDKGRFSGKSGSNISSDSRIKSGTKADFLDELLIFSFKFYDANHCEFNCRDRESEYFHKLLERIRDLSREKVSSLTNRKADTATRFHPVDFNEARVSASGFGIGGWEEYDADAWQFSISKRGNGRVHGFLIENVFYVVWLDPRHRMYPSESND